MRILLFMEPYSKCYWYGMNWAQVRQWYITSYPLFASADAGIYPHAASQYHARPKAKRGIAMLRVDKFPYPRKQTRGNEFIPCSNNICDILKRFRSFKIPAITLIWPKSSYKHSVTRSYRSGEESGRRSESPLWRHQWRSFVFISHADIFSENTSLHGAISQMLLIWNELNSSQAVVYLSIDCVYPLWPSDCKWRHWSWSTTFHMMALPGGTNPSLEPKLIIVNWTFQNKVVWHLN